MIRTLKERGLKHRWFQLVKLVASLSPIACITGLLFISTTALAQNSSTDDIQSEIIEVDRKIVPANSSTVKANVTVIPLTNITGIHN